MIKKYSTKNVAKYIVSLFILIFLFVMTIGLSYRVIERNFFYPIKYEEEVENAALNYGFDKFLIYSVIKVESNFNQNALSKKNAKGLMQILDSTAEFIARKKGEKTFDLFNPKTNIDFGVYYLKYLYEKFGEIDTALYAYNAGEGKVYLWLQNENYSSNKKTLKKVPYKETAEYLIKIKKTFLKYVNLYSQNLDKEQLFE